ncbi:MAG: von Willebrand factor type [Pseudonocardiales bacterium]|nr:von Willebrand factor type [Pseudonocardiales bacterium]
MGRHHVRVRSRGRGKRLASAAFVVGLTSIVAIGLFPARYHEIAPSAATCSDAVTLSIAAAPSIAPSLERIAQTWNSAQPRAAGRCISATVTSVAPAATAAAVASATAVVPDLWVPDSSLWLDQVASGTAAESNSSPAMTRRPAVATTPLIVAAAAGRAAQTQAAASGGWPGLLTASAGVAPIDPNQSTEGLAAVIATRIGWPVEVDGAVTEPSAQLVADLVAAPRSTEPTVASALAELISRPSIAAPIPVTEQELVSTIRSPATKDTIVAVYPAGPTALLDFPLAQFTYGGQGPARQAAATAFAALLADTEAQQVLHDDGFRNAAGDVLDQDPLAPVGAPAITALPAPSVTQVADARRLWTATGRTDRLLTLVDASQSMGTSLNGQAPEIQAIAAAVGAAPGFLPDRSSLGGWTFSTARTTTTDWAELVGVGPLDAEVGAGTRRQALAATAVQLPTLTFGATSLYNSLLAAFEAMRASYDPNAVNTLVVVSGGANTDPSGVDLATLLARLKSETSGAQKVAIMTVAVGTAADSNALAEISAASGGRSYTAGTSAEVRAAVLDALIRTV